jgi:membrane protease YdiL (CAAX protease family)
MLFQPLRQRSYLLATRHPWPCLLFLLPLLIAYEGGVIWLGGAHPDALRNGADAWLRWGLESFGLPPLYWPPAVIATVFAFWSLLRTPDRPADLLGVVSGMGIESVLFALGLWGISQGLLPLLTRTGLTLDVPPRSEEAVGQVITYVGAGIYEEVLFRLVLFSTLDRLLSLMRTPWPLAPALAALGSAACFAAAHHIGPFGEPYDGSVFLFRMLAGLYFALLFRLRGFGVAVGAHACYDVLVGVAIG